MQYGSKQKPIQDIDYTRAAHYSLLLLLLPLEGYVRNHVCLIIVHGHPRKQYAFEECVQTLQLYVDAYITVKYKLAFHFFVYFIGIAFAGYKRL